MNIPDPPLSLITAFHELHLADSPDHILQAPGRDLWIAAVIHDTNTYTFHAPDFEGKTTFSWRTAKDKRTILKRPLPRWARYPAGVVVELCARGFDIRGVEAVIAGHEAPGPRYDYGMGVAVAALWHTVADAPYDVNDLLSLVDRVRRNYITSS